MSKLLPVTKVASDYSENELMQFQKQFAPVAQKIHYLHRCEVVFLALMSGNMIISIVVFAIIEGNTLERIPAIILLGILGISSALTLFFSVYNISIVRPKIKRLDKCPACHKSFLLPRKLLQTYCFTCGNGQLEKKKWSWPECNDCGKRFKLESMKIRYCTHCGVFLDEKGFILW